jgi:small-conductance mechanosensitive channel
VDVHEQHHLDEMARQMAKVKARTRPWRAIITLVLAVAAGIAASTAARDFESWTGHGHAASKLATAGATVAFCLFAIIGILDVASRARGALQPVAGSGHAAVIRYSIVLVGAILTFVIALALLKVPVGQLVLGGALTTILIGIAAQQSLGNVFAGLVLLLSRPFLVGETIQLRSGAMGGLLEGTVTEIGITYLRLETADGPMSLPNSQVLAAAVGRPKLASHTAEDGHGAAASNHQAAPATPADAPTAPPSGQQAGPADLGLTGPAGKRQPEGAAQPRSPGNASPPA